MIRRRLFAFLLRVLPRDVRERHGREMAQVFRDQQRDTPGLTRQTRLVAQTAADVSVLGAREHVQLWRQDVSFGLRTLRRQPAFTLAAVLTLALGIGANSAIFSVVNAVLLKPLPYAEPDRIVQLVRQTATVSSRQSGHRYLFYREHAASVSALAAWRDPTGVNVAAGGSAEFARALPISHQFFDVFGVRPALGDRFRPEHDTAGGAPVTILSPALWRRMFGGDPSAIGSTVSLGGQPYTVIGVMPAEFTSVPQADLYIPFEPSVTGPGSGFNYFAAGRLAPGVTLEQANAEAATLFAAFAAENPKEVAKRERPMSFSRFQDTLAAPVRPALLAMLGAVGLLLLIACVNMANLLLARAVGRGREMALRAALGASRRRIVRQLLSESLLLALGGGALGIGLAAVLVPLLLSVTPAQYAPYQNVTIDGTVLMVTLVLTIATGLLFGIVPALTLSRTDLAAAFKEESTRSTGGRKAILARQALGAAEVALCMVLLVGAAVLFRTFWQLQHVDLGFNPDQLLVANMSLQGSRRGTPESASALFDEGLRRIRQLPGVSAAAVVSGIPIDNGLNVLVSLGDGVDNDKIPSRLTDWRYASAGYLEAIGIRPTSGRTFSTEDRAGAPAVAIVNQTFARRFYPGQNPIGRHISLREMIEGDPEYEIVGVVPDVQEQGLTTTESPALMYVPAAQASRAVMDISHTYFPISWVVRTTDRPAPSIVDEIRRVVHDVDPLQPFSRFRTMDEVRGEAMIDESFQTMLLGLFGGIGLLLATAGVHGLIAHNLSQRLREFGIRVALGASRATLLRGIVGQAVLLTSAGVLIGGVIALLAARSLRSVYPVAADVDPIVMAIVGAGLLAVTIGASLVPALGATRVNPVDTLRNG